MTKMSLKTDYLKLCSNLSEIDELNLLVHSMYGYQGCTLCFKPTNIFMKMLIIDFALQTFFPTGPGLTDDIEFIEAMWHINLSVNKTIFASDNGFFPV